MIVKNIRLHNFKSIKDLYLDFETIQGLYEIRGVVGAGKTTLSEAILFGLFGSVRNKNNRDLVRWGEKKCDVEINLISKGQELNINRSIKGNVSSVDVLLNGEPIIFTNKRDIQKQLETEYYDTSRLVIETLFIISFNNFKSISSLNSRDLKEFIDNVFNLYIVTNYANICKDEVRKYQNDEIRISSTLNGLKSQIETFNNLKKTVTVSDEEYNSYKSKLDEFCKKLTKYKNARDKKLNDISNKVNNIRGEISVSKSKLTELKKNIEFIKKEYCPTCGAKIDSSKLPTYLQQEADLNASIDTGTKKLNEFNSEYSKTKEKANNAIQEVIDKINETNKILYTFDNHKKQMLIYESTISGIEENLNKSKEEYNKILKNIDIFKELLDVLNSNVRQNVMKSIIPLINTNITHYVHKLNLPYNISFTDEFVCEINTPICESIQTSNLSTGQTKTVDMIIILSILKVLLNSFNMNLIFLDELFSNLDEEIRRTMCILLKEEIHLSKTIFIISHSELPGDLLDGKIIVERSVEDNSSSYQIL